MQFHEIFNVTCIGCMQCENCFNSKQNQRMNWYVIKAIFFCNGRWQERMKRVWMKLSRTKKGFVASAIHCIECQTTVSLLPASSNSKISGRLWEILTLYKIDQNISEGENLQCDHWFIVRHILLKKAMNEWEPCKIGPDCCQWHRSPELGVNLIWRFTLWLLWSTHMEQLSWE